MKYVYVQRNDEKFNGSVVDMTQEQAEMAIKRHPKWKILGDALELNEEQHAPKSPVVECPICGYKGKNDRALFAHKRTHK